MSEPVIVLDNVSKQYPHYRPLLGGFKHFLFNAPAHWRDLRRRPYEVFKSVSFSVSRGETLGVIGRNGAGKSTLLGLIAQVIRPTTGSIKINGRVSPLLELGAGFHPELTGRENILLNGILLGLTRRAVVEKMGEIIAFSELELFIDQPLRTYSTGMIARLGFSVVGFLDPEILLVDEIFTVGDMEFQKKCQAKAYAYKKSGITIIFVSHSMEQVREMCDRVVWLEDHGIKMIGPTDAIVEAYTRAH
ncbi:MAG: ABC transporter ATP-binding protein [candidate division FCPU426 bacterium]